MNNILDIWPFPYPPRDNQVTAFEWLQQNQDKKYLILEAPVGCGKSNIGITYSMFTDGRFGSSFVLTPQRILQEQYESSMRDIDKVHLASLYGKGNYQCDKVNASCEVGGMIKPRCEHCPHARAKKTAVASANTVLNYKLALTSFCFTDTFKRRQLMIMDECHTLEEHLVEFDAARVASWVCNKYDIQYKGFTDINKAVAWLKSYWLEAMGDVISDMAQDVEILQDKEGTALSAHDIKRIREYESLVEQHDNLMVVAHTKELERDFVLVHDDTMFQFKRLTGAYTFKRIVEPMADQFLFMSSTILNKEGFCKDLGIDLEDAAFLSLQSDFPVENRPIYYSPVMKVNAGWKKDMSGQQRLLDTIQQLMDMHTNESGVIHTGNFAIAEFLVNKLKVQHKVFHHNPSGDDNRNDVINAFIDFPKPSVLISPSSTEGLDLKGDLGGFAMFAKVPFGYLGDQWIKRRMELSNEWYRRRALINMIQGGGRVVRSEDDEGAVYILDECFAHLYNTSKAQIPQWWKDSYITI